MEITGITKDKRQYCLTIWSGALRAVVSEAGVFKGFCFRSNNNTVVKDDSGEVLKEHPNKGCHLLQTGLEDNQRVTDGIFFDVIIKDDPFTNPLTGEKMLFRDEYWGVAGIKCGGYDYCEGCPLNVTESIEVVQPLVKAILANVRKIIGGPSLNEKKRRLEEAVRAIEGYNRFGSKKKQNQRRLL